MTTATTTKHTLVIIDAAIDDHQILAQGIKPTAKVTVLNKHQDGIAQISALCKNHPAASLQIIAHGSPGSLQLGNSQINLDNLHTYRQQLQQWLAAEILIYGCEVARGETGKTFIEQLHQLTGANIAASAQKIGNAQQGGTWELEVNIGQIASTLALQPEIREAYPGVFATFATATNFTVGTSPRSVTVADFNGDGKLDLAVANFTSDTLSVLLGNGTGGFDSNTNFTVGSSPESVTAADFNGDGKLDLATANYNGSNVSVLLGNGTGGFATATNFTVGSLPQSVTVRDFNGDGKLDLAVANYGSNTVSVLLGNGTGGFATATNFTVGTSPYSVTEGDFNGDGKLDLAVANRGSNNVSVLLGNGTGGFATATNFTVGTSPRSVTVGDFNGDGKLDLATANFSSNTVSVLLGNGTGGFDSNTNFTVGTNPYSVTEGDFNGDGKLDLATANRGSNNVSVLLGNGTGGFATATNFTVVNNPNSVTLGDFNGDGKLDLATANKGSGDVSVLLNTTPKITIASGTNPTEGGATGSFTITTDTPAPVGGLVVNFNTTGTATPTTDYTLAAGTNITAVTANTFTIAAGQTTATLAVTAVADAIVDPNETVTVNLQSSPDYILGASSTANFQPATNFTVGIYPFSVTVGDFNSDGKLDLAVANQSSGNVSVLLGNGTGGFDSNTNFTVGSTPRSVTVGDFNADGKLDLAVANYSSGNVSVLLGNGTGGFATATNFTVGSGPQSVTVGDFNGDGKLDLAVANYSSGNVSVLLGNGTGGFATATNFTVGSSPQSVTVGDFNGDGKLDLAVANYSSGNVSVLLGNGTGGFATATNFTVGSGPQSVTVGDFNGDGKLDLAVANYSSGNVSVLLGNGTGGFATATNFTVGSSPQSVTVGDFNGDGKLDLAVANYSSGNVSVLLGNGTGGFATATNFTVGSGPQSVTVGDFNADGKLDLAATNFNSGSVSVLLNANSATLTIAEPIAPVTTATATALAYTENDPATIIDVGITVTDADSTNLSSATVTITTGFAATEDTLAFTDPNNIITGTYTNGVLTLTGTATVAQYQTALQSVTYQNSSDNPSATPRTISFVVNDGSLDSSPATRDIDLTAVNDAPVTTATATALAYTKNDAPTAIDPGITVTDADSTNLSSATVTITTGFAATEDTLAFTDPNNIITGTYTNGVLTLTGTATVAQYQTALQSVTYQNSSDNPSTTPRTISFVVNDGSLDSSPATRDINVALNVNAAPTDLELSANTVNDEAPANTAIGTFSSTDPDQNDNFVYSLVSGIDDVDNNAFTVDDNTLKIKNSPDFKTKASYKIRVRTTDNGNLTFEKGLTINVNDEIPSRLTNPDDDVFNITGQDIKVTLEIKLTGHNSQLVNELGLFTVDDAKGTINGIAPGAVGYAEAAIERSQVILSAIANTPNGFDTNNLSRLLQLNSGQSFRFLLVQDGTLNAVRNDPKSIGKLLFSSVSTQKITALGDNSFSLGWKDAAGKSATDFNGLVLKINQTNQALPLGTNLQGQFQGEVIDLRDVKQSVKAEFNVYREASYNNYVGFYQVTDANGGIDTNGDGKADVLTGQAGYIQAAVHGRVAGIDLSVSNQGSATETGTFQPGAIFVPFIIVNGRPDALLDNNSNNDPAVYFPFLGANSDKTDHIRLLASNTFGFEDLSGGGDRDFNDVIIKANLTTTI